jgi:PII-like signaling protein
MVYQATANMTGKRIRIFISEAEEWQGKPLYRAILELLQKYDVMGATVVRGIEGFGPRHHLSTERLPDISNDLPLIIDVIEREEKVAALLPLLDQLVQRGTMTVSTVQILHRGNNA